MVTPKSKIQQIINVFETGIPAGKYDAIAIFADGKDGARQITYGRSQTTEQGNLKTLINMYIARKGLFANDFEPYVKQIGEIPLVDNAAFKALLGKSALEDEIMRSSQDEFFDILYYTPALAFYTDLKLTLPLSLLVVYDSFIHSGRVLPFLRERFTALPPSRGGDEKKWVREYVRVRHDWLGTHTKKILRNTTYRTQCFLDEIKKNNWDLKSPVTIMGIDIV